MTTGELIKKRRLDLGMTQKKLGEKCGIADSAVRKYESGKVKPKLEMLTNIANALGCTVVDLLATGEKDGKPTFATGADFDAALKSIADKINAEDDAYIEKLRVPALKLNWRGRKLLLDQAELYTTFEMFTSINGNETKKED